MGKDIGLPYCWVSPCHKSLLLFGRAAYAVSDITYLPLSNGEWAYLGAWVDLFSRRIVGWRVDDHMEDDLVILPLGKALQSRQPSPGLITHSDRGGQYVSNDWHELINLWHIRPSMSRAAPRRPTIRMTMPLA